MTETADTSHLDALHVRLSHERARLSTERNAARKELRQVWVAGIEKEIAAERAFLGLTEEALPEMSDDELLAELGLQ